MKRRLKWKALALAMLILVTAMLTACGQTGNTGDSSQTTVGTDTTAQGQYTEGDYTLPIASTPLTLSFMGRDSETPGTSFNTDKALIYDEIAKKTGISIKWDVIPNEEYVTTMGIRLSSKSNLDDIICIVGDPDGSQLVKYYQDGILIDMKPLIDKYAPNLKKLLDDNPEIKKGLTLPGGQIVAFGGMNLSKYSAAQTMIRKDWLDKFNLPVPSTPDELYTAMKTFIDKDANGNGKKDEVGLMGADYTTYRQLGTAFSLSMITGGGWSVRDGKVSCEWTLPQYRALLQYLNKLYTGGLMPKDFDNAAFDTSKENAALNNGTLGVLSRGWTTQTISLNDPTSELQKNTPGAYWVPIVWKDTGYGLALPKENTTALWRTFGISSACKDPIAAIRFFDYMIAGAGRDYECYGIEGVSYKVENGQKIGIQGYDKTLAKGTMLGSGYFTSYTTDTEYLASFNAAYLQSDSAKKDALKKIVDAAVANVTEPFQPPMASLEDGQRISVLSNDLKTYKDEMYAKFVRGQVALNDTEWNKYVAQMKKLGTDEIAAIYQKGVDKNK